MENTFCRKFYKKFRSADVIITSFIKKYYVVIESSQNEQHTVIPALCLHK